MNKKTRKRLNSFLSIKRIIGLSLIISLGFHVLFALSFFFGDSLFVGSENLPPAPRFRFDKMLIHTVLSLVLLFILFVFNRRMMSINFTKKWREIFFVVFGSVLITTALSIGLSCLPLAFDPHSFRPPFHFRMIRDSLVRDYSLMAIVVMACFLLRALYNQKVIAVENEELRTENIRSHYEALKSQLDPHFLFNSMNTLQSLIELDKDKASDFVQQLSSVLRYTLQSKETVTLAEELECVRAYCGMMHIRYGYNLKFDFQVDTKYNNFMILPLSVQGLIENAIKHNVISAKQPLEVRIVANDQAQLTVSNPILPKIMAETGSGIGLANLAERYRLKWETEIGIVDDGKVFEVVIPLVEPIAEP